MENLLSPLAFDMMGGGGGAYLRLWLRREGLIVELDGEREGLNREGAKRSFHGN